MSICVNAVGNSGFYNENEDFKNYVDNYCVKHNLSIEEAFRHEMVTQYRLMLTGGKSNDIQ